MLNANGPTQGNLVLPGTDKSVKSIAFIHCAGSRDKRYKEYCSGICCAEIVKLSHLAKKKNPDVKTVDFYSHLVLSGKGYEEFSNKYVKDIDERIRVDNTNDIKLEISGETVKVKSSVKEVSVDLVVAAPALEGVSVELAEILSIAQNKDGFLASEHRVLSPAVSVVRGIYLAGAVSGPKDICDSNPYNFLQW